MGGLMGLPHLAFAKASSWYRIPLTGVDAPPSTFPAEKRVPLGWKAFPVAVGGAESILHFPKTKTSGQKVWLRITAAIDFREHKLIKASLAKSGRVLGLFDIRYAHPFQPFQIEIKTSLLKQVAAEGIALTLAEGTKTAWFFMPDHSADDSQGLRPQLLVDGEYDAETSLGQNLCSMNSFSPFGWMGGCVQDALLEMSVHGNAEAENTLLKQLNHYLDEEKGIVFENPRTEPIDGHFNSIEDFLPFAAIVRYFPNHQSVELAVDYIRSKEADNGLIATGYTGHTTTEGCYTLAYPLACIAGVRSDRDLAEKALRQMILRTELLSDEQAIYQRTGNNGPKGFANWGRGTVWYLLGIVKTLHALRLGGFGQLADVAKVEAEFVRAAAFVAPWQNADGLWYSFLNRPATEMDTTASAGLAAAFAWGHRLGYLNEGYKIKAEKAYQALLAYVTPDGFMTHVSQINRGGEDLQANGYRVISQFALGLMAQLKWALNK